MDNNHTKPIYHQFVETCRSECTKSGTAACRADIVIRHKDTLGYKLPAGIKVKVYDRDGGVYYGQIDDFGDSRHFGVKCGDISWQLLKGSQAAGGADAKYSRKGDGRKLKDKDEQALLGDSDGYVLLRANDEKNEDPRLQLAKPLQVFVSVNEREVNAVYLPPPIVLNLRFRQNHQTRLTRAQINQIKLDGNTATLFIHGYNVPLGEPGHFPQAEDFGEIPGYFNLPEAEEVQRPYLYYGEAVLQKSVRHIVTKKLREDTGERDNVMFKQAYEEVNKRFNGTKALGWFPHVEYYLNLAASGKQDSEANLTAEDWMKYSRIIGVTWSGSVSPALVFFRAEMYANEAGRELAKVLIQLIEANIKINIITHSLGARVALSALNILGDFDGAYDEAVDNLIMWEAAVADNAITHSYTRAKNPVAMELFPFAYKAVKRMQVLYSQEDGVLGGDRLSGDREYTGLVGGAYPKKYTSLANTTGALKDYYHKQNLIGEYYREVENLRRDCLIHRGSLKHEHIGDCVELGNTMKGKEIKGNIEKLLQAEAEAVSSDLNQPLNYLKPWSHFRRFRPEDEYFKHIVDVLIYQVFNNWKIYIRDMAVRPALGHQGNRLTVEGRWFNNELLSKARKIEWFDPFIAEKYEKQFWFWDQSNYFISHSAMREFEFKIFDNRNVFPRIYKDSYKDRIMDGWIKENSKFGRY